MRVLWIGGFGLKSHNSKNKSGYNGGGWLTSLQKEIMKCQEVTLGIVVCRDSDFYKEIQDGISYYVIPNYIKSTKDKILDLLYFSDATRDEIQWSHYEMELRKVIDDFNPDVIQVFGSEFPFALATKVAGNVPTILHIQGLLSLYIYIPATRYISLAVYHEWKKIEG